ncbi:MAG: TIGR03619 family F420-dependent LLM class oxidoreductase [Actinobacteria bacterium]|nr:TIGR03619 family F420-dependent LLM class oxidoreductase [Actinomycetota bacterium]
MQFGLMFANTGAYVAPDAATALARAAEEAGFESIWTVEHVVVPSGYESQYPYDRSGRMPGGADAPIPDPLIWLTWVAAATERLRLGTGILILPQRNPVVLAKELATLDLLSGGRLLLGIGVGWLREEFEALGVPFDGRGARTDEYVAAMRALWRDDDPSFAGEHVQFTSARMWPKAARPTGVPIIVGGHTEAAARRAGRLGDGFFPGRTSPKRITELLGVMRAAAADAGRDADAIEVTAGGALDLDGVKAYADLGVDRMIVPNLWPDPAECREGLLRFGEDVIARS